MQPCHMKQVDLASWQAEAPEAGRASLEHAGHVAQSQGLWRRSWAPRAAPHQESEEHSHQEALPTPQSTAGPGWAKPRAAGGCAEQCSQVSKGIIATLGGENILEKEIARSCLDVEMLQTPRLGRDAENEVGRSDPKQLGG